MLLKEMFIFSPKSKRNAAYGQKVGQFPFFTSSNLIDRFVDEPDYSGEYLIIGDGGTGNCKYYKGKFSVSNHNYLLQPKKGTNALCVKYFLMKDCYKVLNDGFKGVGIKNVSKKYIESIDYAFNKRFSENEIVENLQKIESLIDEKKKQITTLDSLVKSRFMEMFGDPILNNRNWPINTVANCCYMKGMKNIPQKEKYWLLNLDKIESNTGEIIKKDYVVKDKIGNSTFFFDKDYVLYSKLRPYLNKVVIPNESGFATSELVPLKPNSFVNAVYLAHLLRSKSFVKWIDGTSSGAKMPRASVDALRSFMLPLPPIELQNKFVDFVHLVDKSRFVVHSRYFLWLNFTFESSTIAYSRVVSIFECPKRC